MEVARAKAAMEMIKLIADSLFMVMHEEGSTV